jgi:putative transposase
MAHLADRAGCLKEPGRCPVQRVLDRIRVLRSDRTFLRRLLAMTPQKPLRVTTDKHPAYTKAIRWIVGRNVLHRQSQYLNNRIEQDHRALKQRYYPMLCFGRLASAERFCAAFEELRQYLRIKPGSGVTLAERRAVFVNRWHTLMVELAA